MPAGAGVATGDSGDAAGMAAGVHPVRTSTITRTGSIRNIATPSSQSLHPAPLNLNLSLSLSLSLSLNLSLSPDTNAPACARRHRARMGSCARR